MRPAKRARITPALTHGTSDGSAPQSQSQAPSPTPPSNFSTDGNELELADGGELGTSTGGRGGRGCRNAGGGRGEGGVNSVKVTRGGGQGSHGGGGQSGCDTVSTASAFVVLLTTFSMTVWLSDLYVLLMVRLSSHSSQG